MGTNITILNPDIRILRSEWIHGDGILHEHRRMGFARMMHNLSLVILQILNSNHRRNQFTGSTEMVKLTTGKRQYRNLQFSQLRVIHRGMGSQSQTKFTVEIVFLQSGIPGRPLHQQLHGTVREHPNSDICQIEMFVEQTAQCFHSRLLQHAFHLLWVLPRRYKNPMILGNLRTEPQTIADHIGIGYRLKGLSGTDIDIPAHNHRMQTFRGCLHHLLIERHLQGKQVLRKPLSPFPTEYGKGSQYLS